MAAPLNMASDFSLRGVRHLQLRAILLFFFFFEKQWFEESSTGIAVVLAEQFQL